MFLRIFFLLLICGCFSVHSLSPVSPAYRKAELALRRYLAQPACNSVIYSLLNVLIHDKQAKAFITEQAIEMALEHVKELDQTAKTNNEQALRQIIYASNCKPNDNNCFPSNHQKTYKPTADLKQHIASALDKLFIDSNVDDDFVVNKNKR
jgi:hypothetical protein